MGQASSSSVPDTIGSFNFDFSDFVGERSKELACVLQSDSSRSSQVAKFSMLLPLTVSLKDSESVDCRHPKTTSYGKGAGGGRKVSGVDVFRFSSTMRPTVNVEAVPLRDVKFSCSSKPGGHCRRVF